METMISALIYNSNKSACHFRSLAQINYFASNLKMTVFTSYLEIFFNFSQGIPRSTFMATIVSASTLNGRIFANLRMVSLSHFSNDCIRCAACFFEPSLPEQIDDSFLQNLIFFVRSYCWLCYCLCMLLELMIVQEAESMKYNAYMKYTLRVFREFCCTFRTNFSKRGSLTGSQFTEVVTFFRGKF